MSKKQGILDKRVGRKKYFLTLIVLGLVYKIVEFLLNNPDYKIIGSFLYLLTIPLFVYSLLTIIWRLNDIEKPKWWLLLLLVPIVNIVIGVIIAFRKGTGRHLKEV